jgi:hypothetical protein
VLFSSSTTSIVLLQVAWPAVRSSRISRETQPGAAQKIHMQIKCSMPEVQSNAARGISDF